MTNGSDINNNVTAARSTRAKGAKLEDVYVHDTHGFNFASAQVNLFQTFSMSELLFKEVNEPPEDF